MNRLRSYWIGLRASLWFVPSLIVLASMGAAVLMTETDGRVGLELATHWPRLFGASADASRGIGIGIGIGIGSMLQFVLDHDRIVRLAAATGAFVAAGSPVIDLSGSDAPTQDDARRLRGWAKPRAPAHSGAGRQPSACSSWSMWRSRRCAGHQRPDHRPHVHRPARRALGVAGLAAFSRPAPHGLEAAAGDRAGARLYRHREAGPGPHRGPQPG